MTFEKGLCVTEMRKISAIISALLILMNIITAYAVEDASQWAESYVESAVEKGLVPDDINKDYTMPMTRAEFTHIAVRLISAVYSVDEAEVVKCAEAGVFDDTSDKYVAVAYAYGIIDGKGGGKFYPNEKITREEAAKILVKTHEVCSVDKTENQSSSANYTYSDFNEISEWAREYVNDVRDMSVMNGVGDGRFDPDGVYTREQGIVTFLRLFEYITENQSVYPSVGNKNPEITSMLNVRKGMIWDGEKEVVLNGVNLGGWLLMEQWMSPVDVNEEVAYADITDILTSRFGKDKARTLIGIYEDNYITETDFEIMESLGFNCIRVPFWYRNFTDENGEFVNSAKGFKRLDWVLEMCKKYNMYAILDMHGCPGGQSMNHGTGTLNKNELYTSEKNLRIMEELWVKIAERYKNNKYIAAYDIMNEPQNNEGATGKNAWPAESRIAVEYTNGVYDRMIKAIRKVDKRHIITIEGIWTLDVLPAPAVYNWSNMMYQLHIYDEKKSMIDMRVDELLSARDNYGVAPLVGEYNSKIYERYANGVYKKENISRVKWTYKTVGVWYDGWGLFNKDIEKVDIEKASYSEIAEAFGDGMLTENGFELNRFEYNMIR